jgi:hypothetical protein
VKPIRLLLPLSFLVVACRPDAPPQPGDDPPDPPAPAQLDMLLVTSDALQASAARYADFRRERGFTVEVLAMGDVVDGAANIGEVRTRLKAQITDAHARRLEDRAFFVLFLGDATTSSVPSADTIPTNYVTTQFDNVVASDNAYADLDGDDLPDFGIGRIAARSDAEVDAYRARLDAYETEYEPGPWNRRVTVFASTGGFGDAQDALIEQFATTVLDRLPPAYDISMTYAKETSPYVYIPERFSDKVYERINEGSLIAAYVGHGSTDAFADLEWRGRRFPIMDTSNLGTLDVQHKAPILTIIACLTGGFDRGDSLSERILRDSGGPTAVLSSTEISHPIQNALFTYELSQTLTVERPTTIGELVVRAKARLFNNNDDVRQQVASLARFILAPGELEGRNHSHAHMYTLFGDPSATIPYPRNEAALDVARDGDDVVVTGTLGDLGSGEALVTVETARDVILGDILEVPPDDDPTRNDVIEANYDTANDKVVASATVTHAGGALSARLPLPAGLPAGRYLVKVYADDGIDDAVGGTTLTLP